MRVLINNTKLYLVIRSFVSIAESLVIILSLGFLCPDWSLDFGVWRLRKRMAQIKAKRIRKKENEQEEDRP